jgi:hypothetical protein
MLSPSSCRRLLRLPRRLPRPLPLLPRLALVGGGYRQLPTDGKNLSRGITYTFWSCPRVRLVPSAKAGVPNAPHEGLFERERGVDPRKKG